MPNLKHIQTYEEMNEGLVKNWLKTFIIMAGLGIVPLSVLSGDKKEKQEFVESQSQAKIDAALFTKFMSNTVFSDIDSAFSEFKKSNDIKSSKEDIDKYINVSGSRVSFNTKYSTRDYSNVGIHNYAPENWLTDMGYFIPDENEHIINEWISDYEKKTSVEIDVVTVKSLNDEDIFDYAHSEFNRIGVGKKYANNGILLVFSMDDRKSRIHTGTGVEGDLTDAQCGRILENIIKPKFRQGLYEEGIMDALNEIRSEIGDGAYELKKKAEHEKEIHDQMEFDDNMATFFGWLSILAIMGSIVGVILYIKRKNRLKKEAADKLIADINKAISKIDSIKNNFPKENIKGSRELDRLYNDTKSIIDSITSVSNKNDKENLANLEDLTSVLNRSFKIYSERREDIQRSVSSILGLSKLKSNSYSIIDTAIDAASKIKNLGYSVDDVPSKLEVDRLDDVFTKIQAFMVNDIDGSISLLKEYTQKINSINSRGSKIKTKLSSIENDISRVKNWESTISSAMGSFNSVANSSEKSKLNSAIESFKLKLGSSKDYVMLSGIIDDIISIIKSAISRDNDEKRRKREEEEEERRRKRRREEEQEEEDRRRRSSYSSSYSSSSSDSGSFGGFGGGSSSGGGASGGW